MLDHTKRLWATHVLDRVVKRRGVVDLPSHSVTNNLTMWNEWNWSQQGEEWGVSDYPEGSKWKNNEEWKRALLEATVLKYFARNSVILEVGPGAGRWSFYLKDIASKLILADIAPKCLEICKERFKSNRNTVEFRLIENDLSFIPDNSIDYIWSYDVFVHINPSDILRYTNDFSRILRTGGIAIIHHAGTYKDKRDARKGFRANMSAEVFKHMVEENGMKVLEQNTNLVHKPGDIITVFQK